MVQSTGGKGRLKQKKRETPYVEKSTGLDNIAKSKLKELKKKNRLFGFNESGGKAEQSPEVKNSKLTTRMPKDLY